MTDEYINKKDVVNLGVMMQTHLWTREQTYNAIFCLPSADVAPVVRCEDCKFSELFQNDSSGVMARYCKAFTFERMIADNDFCSYGERKDNEIDRR